MHSPARTHNTQHSSRFSMFISLIIIFVAFVAWYITYVLTSARPAHQSLTPLSEIVFSRTYTMPTVTTTTMRKPNSPLAPRPDSPRPTARPALKRTLTSAAPSPSSTPSSTPNAKPKSKRAWLSRRLRALRPRARAPAPAPAPERDPPVACRDMVGGGSCRVCALRRLSGVRAGWHAAPPPALLREATLEAHARLRFEARMRQRDIDARARYRELEDYVRRENELEELKLGL
ncbi:hypothetical protein FA95DRAFT_1652807 [Auriscalpium vulgare]|uniref:Uncharacterized protein n=1 Tax=Auriscalpium vulgare TaxID=40419 RepID=A0ACB8R7Z0_9AGAM|nr:hypothetical protein FA95DRAFT_1652807 [Auriscalpium vulgare]